MNHHPNASIASAKKTLHRVQKIVAEQSLGNLSAKALKQWLGAIQHALTVLVQGIHTQAIEKAKELVALLQIEIDRRLQKVIV